MAIPVVGPASVGGLSAERGKWLEVLVWACACLSTLAFENDASTYPPKINLVLSLFSKHFAPEKSV